MLRSRVGRGLELMAVFADRSTSEGVSIQTADAEFAHLVALVSSVRT